MYIYTCGQEIPPLTEADYMKPRYEHTSLMTTTIVQRLRDRDVTQLSGNWRERHRRRSSGERARDREVRRRDRDLERGMRLRVCVLAGWSG